MTTSTTTLTDFLLARIAEDEAVARGAYRDSVDDDGVCHEDWTDATTAVMWGDLPAISGLEADYLSNHIARHDPARVAAECEAKRRIVELHPIYKGDRIQPIDTSGTDFGCELCHRLDALHSDSLIEAIGYCDTLLALALPYADHADYNPDWRP